MKTRRGTAQAERTRIAVVERLVREVRQCTRNGPMRVVVRQVWYSRGPKPSVVVALSHGDGTAAPLVVGFSGSELARHRGASLRRLLVRSRLRRVVDRDERTRDDG